MVFNATFNSISVILWWSVLLVEETRIPEENHRTLSHNVVWNTPKFILVISEKWNWIWYKVMTVVRISWLMVDISRFIPPPPKSMLKCLLNVCYFKTLYLLLRNVSVCLGKYERELCMLWYIVKQLYLH